MSQTILVVDDTADMVEFLEYNLRRDGYQIVSASNGRDALNLARTRLPDLIILDLMLPDLDGFTVCEILRCQPSTSKIPVLLLTALAGEIPRTHGFESGATDYCSKPIGLVDLRTRVKHALERTDANTEVKASEPPAGAA
jgi:two-component system, OmpR family, alkaline phosphatase synthesis response regulator PhoP